MSDVSENLTPEETRSQTDPSLGEYYSIEIEKAEYQDLMRIWGKTL